MELLKLVDDLRIGLERFGNRQVPSTSSLRTGESSRKVGWSWTLVNLFQLLLEYPSGLTEMVLKSELEVLWEESNYNSITGTNKLITSLTSQLRSQSHGSLLVLDDTLHYQLSVKEVTTLPGSSVDILVTQDYRPTTDNPQRGSTTPPSSSYRIDCMLLTKFKPLLNRGIFQKKTTPTSPYSTPTLILSGELQLKVINDYHSKLLPTHNILFVLPGKLEQFQTILGVTNCLKLKGIEEEFFRGIPRQPKRDSIDGGLWLQIRHIDPPSGVGIPPPRLSVVVMDESQVTTTLTFTGSQIPLVDNLKVGDYIGLWYPDLIFRTVDPVPPTIEISHQTILFFAHSESTLDSISDLKISKDQCHRLTRIKLNEILPGYLNITLPVRLLACTRNIPIESDTQPKINRCTLVVEDESGVANITVWGEIVPDIISECLPGHLLLLHNISCPESTLQAESGSKLFINAIPSEGFQLINMSTVKGILSTAPVRTTLPFRQWTALVNPGMNITSRVFVGNCVVIDCAPVLFPRAVQDPTGLTIQCHRICRQPVVAYVVRELPKELQGRLADDVTVSSSDTVHHCEFCDELIHSFDTLTALDRCFSLAWLLDDGSEQLLCYGFWKASSDFLDISPDELLYNESSRALPVTPLPTRDWSALLPRGLGYTVPPSYLTPLAVQTIIGHRYLITLSRTPTPLPLPPNLTTHFPLPHQLGFDYQVEMAIPAPSLSAASRLLPHLSPHP